MQSDAFASRRAGSVTLSTKSGANTMSNKNRKVNAPIVAAAAIAATSDLDTTSTDIESTDISTEIEAAPVAVAAPPRVKGQSAANPNLPFKAAGSTEKSVRDMVVRELKAGTARAIICDMVRSNFPGSAAAVLATKHVAWYAGRLKKEGFVLPTATPVAATPTTVIETTGNTDADTEEAAA